MLREAPLISMPRRHRRLYRRVTALISSLSLTLCARAWAGPTETWLWAWERPFRIDREHIEPVTGVAPLLATVRIQRDTSRVQWRAHPLSIPEGMLVVPVVRIELDPTAQLSSSRREDILAALARVRTASARYPQRRPGVFNVQLDFDCPRSQRAAYTALVREIRARFGTSSFISATALVSWCYGDRWLGELAVDEIVPMYFRLGRAPAAFSLPPERRCRLAAGYSTDEPERTDFELPIRYVFLSSRSFRSSSP